MAANKLQDRLGLDCVATQGSVMFPEADRYGLPRAEAGSTTMRCNDGQDDVGSDCVE